jgi:anti-sigma factor RsiW
MTLSRDVILDLLPLYMSGDASDATRLAVDEYLRGDPELAAQVRAGATFHIDPGTTQTIPPDLEMRALRRTRSRLAAMRWLFGLACFFSAISLGVEVTHNGEQVSGALLIVRYPSVMIYPLLVALACWGAYFSLRTRRSSDLL